MTRTEQRREFIRDGQRRAAQAAARRVPPMTFPAYVVRVTGNVIDFTKPDHETYWFGSDPDVFIEYRRAEQETCEHRFDKPDRFGDTFCLPCGAKAWSTSWVRVGLYDHGDEAGTHNWMVACDARWTSLMEAGAIEAIQSILGGQVVAVLDTVKPAKLVGGKGSVPAMKRGVTS